MTIEPVRDWVRVEEGAPGGGVVLQHVSRSAVLTEVADGRRWGIAQDDLARLSRALFAANQKSPQRREEVAPLDKLGVGEATATATVTGAAATATATATGTGAPSADKAEGEETIVERGDEREKVRVTITRDGEGRLILASRRVEKLKGFCEIKMSSSIALDMADLPAVAAALVACLTPEPQVADPWGWPVVERDDAKLTIKPTLEGALLTAWRKLPGAPPGDGWTAVHHFELGDPEVAAVAHAVLRAFSGVAK